MYKCAKKTVLEHVINMIGSMKENSVKRCTHFANFVIVQNLETNPGAVQSNKMVWTWFALRNCVAIFRSCICRKNNK